MTYSKTQLEIIRQFGSKELSEGCLIQFLEQLTIGKGIVLKEKGELYKLGYVDKKNIIGIAGCGICLDNCKFEILGHIPELFPDVARELQKEGYVLELLKVDTIKSVLKISRYDMKKDILIPYKKLLPLIDQDSQLTLIPLLSLIK